MLHHSLFVLCLLYIVHKIDIQYFVQIYHLYLISIAESIFLFVVLLFYLHYGSHHYHMGIDSGKASTSKSLSNKIYLGMLFSPGAHW